MGLEKLTSGEPQLHQIGTKSAFINWLSDDLEIAKEINKILLEMKGDPNAIKKVPDHKTLYDELEKEFQKI